MVKINLYSIGNEKNFNYYLFDKEKNVHKILNKLFEEIFNIRWPLEDERFGDNDKVELIKINIEKNKDFHQRLGKEDSRIDIFFGDKRFFVSIRCSIEQRNKFNRELSKITIMPKPKKSARR